ASVGGQPWASFASGGGRGGASSRQPPCPDFRVPRGAARSDCCADCCGQLRDQEAGPGPDDRDDERDGKPRDVRLACHIRRRGSQNPEALPRYKLEGLQRWEDLYVYATTGRKILQR